MANNNRIVYNLDFKANLTNIQGQIDRLKQSLNTLATPKLGQKMSQNLQTASAAAAKLQGHMMNAFNADTGKLDLARLSLSLKNAGDNAGVLAGNLLKGGTAGREAFMQTVNAITNAQQPLLKVNNMFSSLWTTMKNTARWQISSMALTSIYSGISKALTYAKDLNKTLNDIRIVTGETAESMDRFTKSASKMAKEVGSTTLEVAKANLIYRQQGDAAELSARKAEITTKAANVAFDVSAKDMSQYLTAIWNSYQVGEESLEVFVDKLAYVGANTATDMAEIATSMEKVAATANAVGVSYDQLLATVSTVSSATRQSAEQVGTAFKTIYARMGDLKLKGSVEDEDGLSVSLGSVSEQLGQVGIHILDANGQLRDMGYIVEELGNKWATMSNNEQTAIAQAVGGKRQYTQVMALFENWDKYKKTLEGVATAQGTLSDQNEIFKESWEGALKDAKLEWEELVMSLVNDDFIIDVIQGFSKVLDIIGDISENLGGFKSILLMIVTIFTAKLQPQLANAFLSMGQNFMIAIGQGSRLNSMLLDSVNNTIKAKIANGELTQQEGILAKAMIGVSNATEQYNKNVAKMDVVAKTQGKLAIDTMKQSLESLQNELQEANLAYNNLGKGQSMNLSGISGRGSRLAIGKEMRSAIESNSFNGKNEWNKFYGNLAEKYKLPYNSVRAYGKEMRNAYNDIKSTEKGMEKLYTTSKKVGDSFVTAGKKWGDLDFTQKLSMTTSSLMNVSMLVSSLTSLFDILGDDTKTAGEKIGAAFTALIPIIMSVTSTLSMAEAAGVGFTTALAPLLVVAGVMVTWKLFDHFIVTAKEAKENIKELEAEYKELEGQIKESREKETSINDLYKEYQVLKDLQKYGKLTDEQRQKLVSISEDLVNTYDLEVSGLRDLTGAYNISKSAIEAYTDALRKERLEKQEGLLENKEETNKNLKTLRKSETKSIVGNEYNETNWKRAWEIFKQQNPDLNYNDFKDMITISSGSIVSKGVNLLNDEEYEQSRKVIEQLKKENTKENTEYNKQVALEYNSQMAKNVNDVIEQQTADILNQDEFNLISGFTGTFLSSTTNQYAEDIRTTEKYMKQYAEQVKTFSEKYQNNIQAIIDKSEEIVEKTRAGEMKTLANYNDYYNMILDQQNLIKTAQENNLIDSETLKIEVDKLSKQIEEDIGLQLAKISRDYTSDLNDSQKTIFSKFSDDILELKNNLRQGKIDFDDYLSGVSSKISNTNWTGMMKFELDKDGKIADEFTSSMINTFANIGQEASDAFFSGIKSKTAISKEDMGELDSLISYYEKLSTSMSGAFDNSELVNSSIANLKTYKQELLDLNIVFNKLEKGIYKTTKDMAKDLSKVGITIKDLVQSGVMDAKTATKTYQGVADNAELSSEQLETALGDGLTAQGNAQKLAIQQQKQNMIKTSVASQIIVDNLVNKIKNTFMGFKLKWNAEAGEFTFEGTGSTPETTDSASRQAFANAFGIDDDYGLKLAAADYDSPQAYNELMRHYGGDENDPGFIRAKKSYYRAKRLGASSSTIGVAGQISYMFDNDLFNTSTDGTGTPPPGDGDGDEFEPESLIEPKVNDLIDKYRTIQEKILEGLEADGDILDENIDGWDKIINNQEAQNIARDILIDGEKAIQEGLNTILTDLSTTTGRSMEEISKWINSEGEESEYFRKLKNDTGNDDAVDALEKEFKDYQTIFKAMSESEENLLKLEKDSYEGIKSLREKIVSKMEKEIADIDYVMEELQEKDIVNYDSVRDFLYQKIGKTQELINYYLSQGYLEDSEVIQDLRKQLREFQEFWVDTYDKEYSQRKKELDEIYKEVEYQNKKRIEALQDEITQKQKLIDLEKKHNSAMKELRQTQNDINKNLVESKMSAQWLDKETRELLFNQQDYFEISSKVAEVQEFLNDAYIDYSEKISDLGEDELYLADSLTKQYEAQVAAKKEELEILKASLNLEKKRNALNTALSERNVRVFAGGRWQQVANTESVQKAYQDLLDTENKIAEAKISAAENSAIREEEATVRNLETLKKTYEEQNKMMKEKIEEMEHNWTVLNSNFNLAGQSVEQLTRRFGTAITEMDTVIKQLSANKQSAKNAVIGGGSSNKNYSQTEKDAINNIAWYKGVWESGNAEDKKWAASEAQKEYAKLDSNTKKALENMNAEGAKLFNDKINQKNAKGTRNAKGGISQVNELGIELLATNDGQFIELNPHEKIFNNDQMNFLYDYSRRGVQSAQRKISSTSNYNQDLMNIENITLQLPNVKDTESFAEGLKNLKSYVRNTMTIKKR